MNKKESRKFFEDWLSAYADHLHLVRQGARIDLVRPDASKHPHPADKRTGGNSPKHKPTNA
jgi:hypothetical protein